MKWNTIIQLPPIITWWWIHDLRSNDGTFVSTYNFVQALVHFSWRIIRLFKMKTRNMFGKERLMAEYLWHVNTFETQLFLRFIHNYIDVCSFYKGIPPTLELQLFSEFKVGTKIVFVRDLLKDCSGMCRVWSWKIKMSRQIKLSDKT